MRTAGTFGGSFHLLEARGFSFSNGSEIPVRVLKPLATGKWAIGIGGKVFAARSDVPLEAGDVLRARVSVLQDGSISLRIGPSREDPLGAFLSREGLPDDSLLRTLAGAFLRHQRPLEPNVLRKSLKLLSRDPDRSKREAAVLAVMDDKGWDVSGPCTRTVMELVDYGNGRRGSERRRKNGEACEGKDGLRNAIRRSFLDASKGCGPLQVFNHGKGSHGTWVVAPFSLQAGGMELQGTLRLLQEPVSSRAVRMVLVVRSEDGSEWSFSMPLTGAQRRLTVYCGPKTTREAVKRHLHLLASDFRNLGLEVDDIIHGNDEFDGFFEVRGTESMRCIDTVT